MLCLMLRGHRNYMMLCVNNMAQTTTVCAQPRPIGHVQYEDTMMREIHPAIDATVRCSLKMVIMHRQLYTMCTLRELATPISVRLNTSVQYGTESPYCRRLHVGRRGTERVRNGFVAWCNCKDKGE